MQLYVLGTVLGLIFAAIQNPIFWVGVVLPALYAVVVAIILLVIEAIFIQKWVANAYLTNKDHVSMVT